MTKKENESIYIKIHLWTKNTLKLKYKILDKLGLWKNKSWDRYHNLDKSIGLYGLAKANLEESGKWLNFNNYQDGRITIRFETNKNIDDVSSDISKFIVNIEEYIDDYKIAYAEPPEFVKVASHLASEMAEVMYYSGTLYDELIGRRKLAIIMLLTNRLLKKFKLQPVFHWSELRDYEKDKQFEILIDIILDNLIDKKYNKYIKNSDFIERVLHLLLNCLLCQSVKIHNDFYGKVSLENIYWDIFNRGISLNQIVKR